jgi:hypothetical protein
MVGQTAREKEAIEILRCAAGVIERNGLHKGSYWKGLNSDDIGFLDMGHALRDLMSGGEEPKCCTLGALYWSAGEVFGHRERPIVFDAINQALGLHESDIPDWNDKPSQRKDRVVAALRRAANHLEEMTSR